MIRSKIGERDYSVGLQRLHLLPQNPPAAKFALQERQAHLRTIGQIKFLYYPLLILYFYLVNHDFTEPVISHTSSTCGMVNNMTHIPTLYSTQYWKMSILIYTSLF